MKISIEGALLRDLKKLAAEKKISVEECVFGCLRDAVMGINLTKEGLEVLERALPCKPSFEGTVPL
jgi:hypothetical protein